MDLREYLFRKRISVTEFAKKINYNNSYIGDIINGKKKAGKKLANAIVETTEGEVTLKDLSINQSLTEINQ